MKRIAFLLLLIGLISGCDKEKPQPLPTSKGVFVINEGLFNFGQGEVSFYDPVSNEVTNNLFHTANNYLLGDVAQSMFIKDSVGFIVVNNSAKIEVVKIPSLQHIRTIPIAGSSPRNFLPVNDSIAYVTELFAKKIWVVNYQTGVTVTTVTTGGWTEDLFKIDNDVFVSQKINSLVAGSFATILKINTATHSEQHNVTFGGRDVTGMVKDKLDRIWVAVDSAPGLYGGFYCFDENMVEQKSFFFSDYSHNPSRLCINSTGDRLLFVDKDVFGFSISDNAVPTSSTIAGSVMNIYTMAVDPATDDIYISDALDYIQSSKIYRYDKNGGRS